MGPGSRLIGCTAADFACLEALTPLTAHHSCVKHSLHLAEANTYHHTTKQILAFPQRNMGHPAAWRLQGVLTGRGARPLSAAASAHKGHLPPVRDRAKQFHIPSRPSAAGKGFWRLPIAKTQADRAKCNDTAALVKMEGQALHEASHWQRRQPLLQQRVRAATLFAADGLCLQSW